MCPIYDFTCEAGHTTESRQGVRVDTLPCPTCGLPAKREAVYVDQCIFGETCAKNFRRAEVPRDERRYDKQFRLYQEAIHEIDHEATKIEEATGKPVKLNQYKKGLAKARRIKAGMEAPLRGMA